MQPYVEVVSLVSLILLLARCFNSAAPRHFVSLSRSPSIEAFFIHSLRTPKSLFEAGPMDCADLPLCSLHCSPAYLLAQAVRPLSKEYVRLSSLSPVSPQSLLRKFQQRSSGICYFSLPRSCSSLQHCIPGLPANRCNLQTLGLAFLPPEGLVRHIFTLSATKCLGRHDRNDRANPTLQSP